MRRDYDLFPDSGDGIYFCRFRRVKNSTRVLDAWDYGYKAWPIRIRRKR